MIYYASCPESVREQMRAYVEAGCEPGSFVYAVLANDLTSAIFRADETNYAQLRQITKWVYDSLPPEWYGDEARVRRWMQAGGRQGIRHDLAARRA